MKPALTYLTTFCGQVKAKKNSKQIAYRRGTPFVRTSDAAKAQENMMIAAFANERVIAKFNKERLEGMEVEVEIDFYNHDNNRHDLDNQLATVMDALVKAEVLPDDNQKVVRKETVRYMGIDKGDPRAEVTINAYRKGKKCQ